VGKPIGSPWHFRGWGWDEEAAALGALAVEQESMVPCWPE